MLLTLMHEVCVLLIVKVIVILQERIAGTISKAMHMRSSQQLLRRRLQMGVGLHSIRLAQQTMHILTHTQDRLQAMMRLAVNNMLLLLGNPLLHLLKSRPLLQFDMCSAIASDLYLRVVCFWLVHTASTLGCLTLLFYRALLHELLALLYTGL